jgi:hypothetical protein
MIKEKSKLYKNHPPDVKRRKSKELKEKLRSHEKKLRSDRRHKRKSHIEL